MRGVRALLALIGAFAAACGAGGSAGPTDLGPTGLLAEPEYGQQVASLPWELDPGGELTRCYYLNLNNEEALDVVRFQTAQRVGQHHFNIFVSNLDREDGWLRCPNDEELFVGARPIVDGSSSAVDYTFPEGMAFRLEPNALLIFQLHWINASEEVRPQQFVLNLHTSPEPTRTLVDIYGFTNFDIQVPPRSEATASKDCPVYDNIGLLSMSAHFHARGKLAWAELLDDGGTAAPQRLYETDRWDDPTVKLFDRPIAVGGGDVLRFHCRYDNRDDFTVKYGGSADDEMCFVFGYYFPKVGLIPCF